MIQGFDPRLKLIQKCVHRVMRRSEDKREKCDEGPQRLDNRTGTKVVGHREDEMRMTKTCPAVQTVSKVGQ